MKNRRQHIKILSFTGSLGILVLVLLCVYGAWRQEQIGMTEENLYVSTIEEEIPHMESNDTAEPIIEELIIEPVEEQGILLVNKDNPLPQDYEVELITLPDRVNRAHKEAYGPLVDMITAGLKEGLSFEICSSYRSARRQMELFEEDVITLMIEGYSYEEAYEEVEKETMPPGCSEHSTGLAFDIVALDYQILDEKQELTDENIWLQENCARFGFILRYPKGKEEITQISYESWHFRYVGVEAATYIMENGITLEEYLEEKENNL